MNLRKHIIPRWGKEIATAIEPRQVKQWLRELKHTEKLANGTLARQRRIMSLVFKTAQLDGLISRDEGSNPLKLVRCATTSDFQATVITPRQAWEIWCRLEQPESTLVLLITATGLRIGEALGLKWSDIDSTGEQIHVSRCWTASRLSRTKSQASRAAVPMNSVLAVHLQEWRRQSPYASDADWIFPSMKNKGRTPRQGGMIGTDHLRKAAIAAGVIKPGEALGMHSLRHSLATYLVSQGCDPKTVQGMLRHSNVHTTLQLYSHGRSQDRLDAQGTMLDAFFTPQEATVQ